MKRTRYNGNGNKPKQKAEDVKKQAVLPEVVIPEDLHDEATTPRLGRPSKLIQNPEHYCMMIVYYMSMGMTKEAAGVKLNISPTTVWLWERKGNPNHEPTPGLMDDSYNSDYEPFYRAITEGELLRQIWWEESGRLNIGNPMFNSTLWMMNMNNLFRKDNDRLRGQGWARSIQVDNRVSGKVDHIHHHKLDLENLERNEIEDLRAIISKAAQSTSNN